MKFALPIICSVLLFFVCNSASGAAAIEVSKASPEVGERITLTFGVPVDTLKITYRPNSSVVRTDILVNDPPTSSMEWASEKPGLVALSYTDRSQGSPQQVSRSLSIRFAGFSTSGLVVMLFAGLVLFGGAATAFRTLFQEQDEGRTEVFDPEELPDT